jgi:alkylated DNA repair protein (DNA oxidative demethylase)
MAEQLPFVGLDVPEGLPPGFEYRAEFLTEAEHDVLLSEFASWAFNEVRMRGVVARRSVRHFGFTYNFDTYQLVEREPWPAELEWVRERAAQFAELPVASLQEALVTKYPKGAPIGWHRDSPAFGAKVIGVSLGSACRMRFRKGKVRAWTTAEVDLPPRSAYVIGGEARSVWQHHIPPTLDLRYSITFRTIHERFVDRPPSKFT